MMSAEHSKRKNSLKQMRIASIGALSITLTILGVIALVRIMATHVERSIREQIHFSVELPQSFTEESYRALAPTLHSVRGIKAISFISADSAMAQIASVIGEKPEAILGYNPLSPIVRIEISGDYLNADSLRGIEHSLTLAGLDAQLQYDEGQLQTLNKNVDSAEWILWGFVVLQGIFAFIQVNNTIRMMIYADRFQIRTLTLVGAKSWFIRKPIVGRSLLDGLIASLISMLIVGGLVYAVEQLLHLNLLSLVDMQSLLIASAGLLLVALTASALAAMRATKRYINMDGRRIFLI